MTPGQIIALIRDTAVVAGIGLILWLTFRGGQDRVKAADLTALQKQLQHQGQQLQAWHQENTDANIQFEKTMAAIRSTPIVLHDWVRPPACPELPMLPAPAGKARDLASAVRPVQPGDGGATSVDWRDQAIAAFKARWEQTLAECRAEHAQWPE